MNKKEQIEKLKQHYHKKFKDRFRIIGKRVTEEECDGTCLMCIDADICAIAKREMEEELEKVLKGVN
ncbi:MAG TPA: hypothetical protein IAC14_02590 [Candidatus Scybalomonas excrementigallinarum]|nr:hypothetical protein [Candidatus Scybalomonas excrementigallinarum]